MTELTPKAFLEALERAADERAALVDELLSTLDRPDPTVVALWAKEAEERLRAFHAGEIAAVTAEEVFAELGKRFRSGFFEPAGLELHAAVA